MAALTVSAEDEKRVKGMGFLSNKGTDLFNARVITVNGKITAAQAKCIAEAAEKFGSGEVEFTTRMTVEVRGVPYEQIDAFQAYIAQEGLVTGGTGPKVRPVVSCKGTTCQYGLLDSFALSEKIHKLFYEGYHQVVLPHKFKIAVGGCPNNCVKPDLNDLGIVGQRIPNFQADKCKGCKKCKVSAACPMKACQVVDGILQVNKDVCNNCGRCIGNCIFDALEDGTYGYRIYLGGRWGKKSHQGYPMSRILTDEEEVIAIVEKAILLFRDQGITGERFADTINRLGMDYVEAQLFSDDLLNRKEEILAADLKK